MQTKKHYTTFRFINYFTHASLLLFISISNMAFADDFENPEKHIQHVYQELRHDLSAKEELKSCNELAIQEYLLIKLDTFLSTQNLLHNIGFKQTEESLSGFPDDFKNQLSTEFKKYIIQDNLSAIKLFCSATNLKTQKSNVDFTVSYVVTSVKLANKKSKRVDFFLLRGWDHWRIADIISGNDSLEERYRNQFGKIIRTEGYTGLLKQLTEINQDKIKPTLSN
ncbi:MAG: ABC transporter substrate-binding protein [Proteobacteria bacterium]|jgi:ABC-type transporter MlaC component|nr:ABC transporter substrate-binding protein [Pseudomonadota bacterium]